MQFDSNDYDPFGMTGPRSAAGWEPPGGGGVVGTGGGWEDQGGGGKGGGGATSGGRPTFNFGPVPRFLPPGFVPPTFEQAQNEPGYQFRLRGGADAMERSAAARGTLRTGGTLKDLQEYGQNFASQEYNNVFARAMGVHAQAYKAASDMYAPLLAQWKMLSDAELRSGLAQFSNDNRDRGGSSGSSGNGDIYDPEPLPPFGDDGYRTYSYA